jgi:hypothetical protein
MLDLTQPYYAEARRLTADTGIKHEVDHVESLASGAPHHHDNLTVCTRVWNIAKAAKEHEAILEALWRGDDNVPYCYEAVCLVVDAVEAACVEASLAGVKSDTLDCLEYVLKVARLSDFKPYHSPVAIGEMLTVLRTEIDAANSTVAA